MTPLNTIRGSLNWFRAKTIKVWKTVLGSIHSWLIIYIMLYYCMLYYVCHYCGDLQFKLCRFCHISCCCYQLMLCCLLQGSAGMIYYYTKAKRQKPVRILALSVLSSWSLWVIWTDFWFKLTRSVVNTNSGYFVVSSTSCQIGQLIYSPVFYSLIVIVPLKMILTFRENVFKSRIKELVVTFNHATVV